MTERPTPDTEPSDAPVPDGLTSVEPGGPQHRPSDDELAAALAAVFDLPPEHPADDDASAWAPAPPIAAATPPPGPEPPPEWAPAASVPPEDLVAASDELAAEPGGTGDEWSWWDSGPEDVREGPPSSEPPGSRDALEDVGFGGPLHSALGELGRIIPDQGVETAPAPERTEALRAASVVAETEALPRSQGRRLEWLSAEGVRQAWVVHGRDWGPALLVAALVLVAFVVVLSAGNRDPSSRIDTRSGSTSVPTSADLPTMLFEEVPPPEEPVDSGVTAADGPTSMAGVVPTTRPRRSARTPAALSPATPARPGSGGVPAPAPAEPPADDSPDDSPSPTTPPSHPMVPPTTVSTPPTTRFDPCDLIEDPRAQHECRRQTPIG